MDFDNIDKEWMKEAPMLAAMDVKNPFSVPEGYFDTLQEHINAQISIRNSLPNQKEIFDVPEDYFNQLSTQIETKIGVEKIKDLVIKDGFTTPVGYFDNLSQRISLEVDQQNKISKPVIRRLIPGWKKYAAAACLTFAIGTAVFFNLKLTSLDSRMSKIPDQEIINYLQIHSDVGDMSTIIQNLGEISTPKIDSDVSAEELEQYINTSI